MFKQSLLIIGLLLGSLAWWQPAPVSAANAAEFNPGDIISDDVFTNVSSMSESGIQSWLNSKNSVCLVNYQSPEPLGNNEYGSNVSTARVIWKSAQLFSINPQVLLVTLQKENGLITRSDCPEWRYRTAMGFACPDDGSCDPNFFGFSKQVYQAARHFKGFYDQTPSWFIPFVPGNNFIPYHPDGGCGGTNVNIISRGTAALYSYTPYQPNQAALNNLYGSATGSGSECASYGNRNFWRDFYDWFGPPNCSSATVPATTLGVYDPAGYFYQRHCHRPGGANTTLQYGNNNWIPLSGDWNNDGFFTPGVYDPNTGYFYLRNLNSSGAAHISFQFGTPGWTPIAGDWNGNGYWSVGLYNPATGIFYLKNFNGAGTADYTFNFGNKNWKPLVGDWDKNRSTTVGVYNPSTATYYLNDQHDGSAAEKTFQYGNLGWTPIAGDWNGNGYWSVGLYNPNASVFYLRNSNSGGSANITVQYGNVGWLPIMGDWDGRR